MKITFFGTPEYVLPILEALHKNFKTPSGTTPICSVVTQKPKPTGRKQLLAYSPVDTWAYKRGVPIFFDPYEIVNSQDKADLGILASYGLVIPKSVIDSFPLGILVVHPSLLPNFRFSSPVPAAILTNTNPTGCTIIKMDQQLDHGPVVAQFKEEIFPDDTSQTLRDRLFAKSADVLVEALPAYINRKINLKVQKEEKATYARMLTKEDAFIPFHILKSSIQGRTLKKKWEIGFIRDSKDNPHSLVPSALSIERFIRAMAPWPGAWTLLRLKATEGQAEKKLKILKAHVEEPRTKNYYLVPDLVQLEGKNVVSWKQFNEAYQLF